MSIPQIKTLDECLALRSGYLVTVNMQHIYECQANPRLREALFASPGAHLCLDGMGAHSLFERLSGMSLPLVPGNFLLARKLDGCSGGRVLVIGTSLEVIDKIKTRYPAVEFVQNAARFPSLDNTSAAIAAEQFILEYGKRWSFIAIALGVPKQEILARALAERTETCPILCIGGSFEILSGELPRAPWLIQKAGLEGVWRLMLQPSKMRWSRMVRSYWSFARYRFALHKLNVMIARSALTGEPG